MMVYKVFCEWDIGQEGIAFVSEKAALNWIEGQKDILLSDIDETVKSLMKQRLLVIEPLIVIDEKGEKV